MRTFKQFLTEDVKLECYINLLLEGNNISKSRIPYREKINEIFKGYQVFISYANRPHAAYININQNQDINVGELIAEKGPKIWALSNNFEKSLRIYDAIQINEGLRFNLNAEGQFKNGRYYQVSFFMSPNSDVKSLAKYLTSDNLTIWHSRNYTGGVLSFLLIKELKHLIIAGNFSRPWYDIIKKHLAGDKDVLDCQEELIKSGLKEFARL